MWKYYTQENFNSVKCNHCEKVYSIYRKYLLKYYLNKHGLTELNGHLERDIILHGIKFNSKM